MRYNFAANRVVDIEELRFGVALMSSLFIPSSGAAGGSEAAASAVRKGIGDTHVSYSN
jgi:hypothetical protein